MKTFRGVADKLWTDPSTRPSWRKFRIRTVTGTKSAGATATAAVLEGPTVSAPGDAANERGDSRAAAGIAGNGTRAALCFHSKQVKVTVKLRIMVNPMPR
jgi:hypothetical protein